MATSPSVGHTQRGSFALGRAGLWVRLAMPKDFIAIMGSASSTSLLPAIAMVGLGPREEFIFEGWGEMRDRCGFAVVRPG